MAASPAAIALVLLPRGNLDRVPARSRSSGSDRKRVRSRRAECQSTLRCVGARRGGRQCVGCAICRFAARAADLLTSRCSIWSWTDLAGDRTRIDVRPTRDVFRRRGKWRVSGPQRRRHRTGDCPRIHGQSHVPHNACVCRLRSGGAADRGRGRLRRRAGNTVCNGLGCRAGLRGNGTCSRASSRRPFPFGGRRNGSRRDNRRGRG